MFLQLTSIYLCVSIVQVGGCEESDTYNFHFIYQRGLIGAWKGYGGFWKGLNVSSVRVLGVSFGKV